MQKEERVLYVFAALLLIILVGVMVPIIGDVHSVPDKIRSTWEQVLQFFGSGYEWLKRTIHFPSNETAILYVIASLVALALLLVLLSLWRRRRAARRAEAKPEPAARKPTPAASPRAAPEPAPEADAEIETDTLVETVGTEPNVELEIEVEPEPVAVAAPPAKSTSRTAENRKFRVHVVKARRTVTTFLTKIFNTIFDFIGGIFQVVLKFMSVVIALLQALVLMVILSGILILSKEWIQKNIEPAFFEHKLPAEFQGLWGGLMFFAILLTVLTAGILLLSLAFSVLARAFAKIVGLGSAPEPKTVGLVMAYLVYGSAVILTLAVFSKFAAVVTALVLFVVAPIVGALLRLTLEEEEPQ